MKVTGRRGEAWRESVGGVMWVLPVTAMALALLAGAGLSQVDVPESSRYDWIVFQGTSDDARALLIGISATIITVIALILGLTVVALQLSSTQYSPRIIRNFLRDRPNQIVLSVFVATFTYSAAGLYTVGVSEGGRTDAFPRAAVSGAIGLLFLSLIALVYEVHHISHSMQIDEIMRRISRNTATIINSELPVGQIDNVAPAVPPWAATITARHSGYIQTIHPDAAGSLGHTATHIQFLAAVGTHVVFGSPLARVWRDADREYSIGTSAGVVSGCVLIGHERTLQQDVAFGIRQLVDIAAKALSPAINDPYTAVQVIDQLATVLASLATRSLGPVVARLGTDGYVTVPARDFGEYLDLACGQIRRYGAGEPAVAVALVRALTAVAHCLDGEATGRRTAIDRQLTLIVEDAQRRTAQPDDLTLVEREAAHLRSLLFD
ncbi:MAG: DUF2254 domain-containing protein [Gordonia sp.]|nr:DUF2254 domain-containing protein [Gordonia sp. (in: high G+C Gram-positive bacteria)]